MLKKSLMLIGAALAGLFVSAEEVDSVGVRFRQSATHLDLNLGRNQANIDTIVNTISHHKGDRINSISIIGGASPEGSVEFNKYLSEARAKAIWEAITDRVYLPDSMLKVVTLGRDWGGLRRAVEFDTRVPYRADVLELLDTIIAHPDNSHTHNLARLKGLHGGMPYTYLYNNIFPSLRESNIRIDWLFKPNLRGGIEWGGIIPLTLAGNPEIVPLPDLAPEEPACHPLYLAVKSNLLYDAAALPSLGFEAYLGKNWSVVANWTYGWWDNDHHHRYWRAYGGDLAVRRWFGRKAEEKPLTGHHLGVYAGVVTYDFEFGGTGHMGGLPGRTLWDRCNIMAGIEYGYSLPIARRLNIDFTIGLGYLGGKVIKYVPYNGFYLWQKTSRLNWVGPTKIEVSLVWLIGCGNYNRKKGGRL